MNEAFWLYRLADDVWPVDETGGVGGAARARHSVDVSTVGDARLHVQVVCIPGNDVHIECEYIYIYKYIIYLSLSLPSA